MNITREQPSGGRVYVARNDSFYVARRHDMKRTMLSLNVEDADFSVWISDENLQALATALSEAAQTIHQPTKEAA